MEVRPRRRTDYTDYSAKSGKRTESLGATADHVPGAAEGEVMPAPKTTNAAGKGITMDLPNKERKMKETKCSLSDTEERIGGGGGDIQESGGISRRVKGIA